MRWYDRLLSKSNWQVRLRGYRERLQPVFHKLTHPDDRRVAVLTRSLRHFNQNRATEAAAAISFYSLLSVFPLLIFVVSLGSLLFSQSLIEQRLSETLGQSFPIAPNFVSVVIQNLLNSRVAINLIAIVFLTWSASGMFNSILVHINRAWGIRNALSMIRSRLVAIGLILGLAIIVLFSLLIPALLSLLHLQGLVSGYQVLVEFMPFLTRFLVIWGLYHIGPVVKIRRRTAVRAAFFVTLASGLITRLFGWYINGIAGFETFYGSLGIFVGLLTWVYLGSYLLLLGAYLMEAIEYYGTAQTGTSPEAVPNPLS